MKRTYDELRGLFKFQLREDGLYSEEELQRIGDALTNAELLEYHQLTPNDVYIPERSELLKSLQAERANIEQQRLMSNELTGCDRIKAILARSAMEG